LENIPPGSKNIFCRGGNDTVDLMYRGRGMHTIECHLVAYYIRQGGYDIVVVCLSVCLLAFFILCGEMLPSMLRPALSVSSFV